ncbi:MAG: glycoside hydrolase family 127 protein [Candidatus Pseudobacter hemicellulosilyticus]|uniref:Glycoside hydrolase family 127 protein n=1 Tax=Candidatus Pseudobacter hemicellulosilyticus TaxID=3121375 RepID=A0AAJ5WSD7_9BACT|nr:MAG: glycoside hydrolase family 127 protein [Pseudobacter sp.]
MLNKGFLIAVIHACWLSTAIAQAPVSLSTLPLENVKVQDGFWSPKLALWNTRTVYDVLDKLEGNYTPDRDDLVKEKKDWGRTRNAFLNFDRVAKGEKNIGTSDGPPWYDGLVYETIRGAADGLVAHPDARLEKKLDAYIDRIAAAQAADPDGFINTYTTLNCPDRRWGTNGGNDRWQHDVYNAGMLIEAGVHYYKATGKTRLLEVALRMTNYMTRVMGPAPKQNIIPAHAGPEEALLKLVQLFRNNPALKQQLTVPVQESAYASLLTFWVEQRGHYANADGSKRESFGSYNQDHTSIFEQQTIEGHAVRATLLGTAIAAMAVENNDARYINTANNYWNNMIGKRLFITGGQGAIPEDEKFGPDYFLPEAAYLETCASLGAGFFSERMNELNGAGKYIDELERVLYNNMLSSVAENGQHYHYENPLATSKHNRWAWHSCPCCPPMFLKMTGALPGFIYAQTTNDIYVNLFIGSEAWITLEKTKVLVKQETGYPWTGEVKLTIDPGQAATFGVKLRIPGWAIGKENPFDLYSSKAPGKVILRVNGKQQAVKPVDGYAVLNRKWKKGDVISLELPVEPRIVTPAREIKTLTGKLAIAAGPLVYALEGVDNPDRKEFVLPKEAALEVSYEPSLAGGVNRITGKMGQGSFTAIPFYAIGNRGSYAYRVWMNE